jgi:hypothetical protein
LNHKNGESMRKLQYAKYYIELSTKPPKYGRQPKLYRPSRMQDLSGSWTPMDPTITGSENGYRHDNLIGLKKWLQQALARFIFRQYRNYNRFARGAEKDPLSMIQLTSLAGSGLRAQGSAQIKAAPAQVERRKWTLVG